MTVKSKITELLKRLNEGVIEKEEVIALSLLSSLAGESIFLLGAPGVAKSLVARRLKYAYKDSSSFEYLMNRFSTPDEIFGPVSISKLKDHDKYERIVQNYLPTATVVFLDEIWKAGPSIQNALLTVLNEKIYRNGEQEIDVPIKALISASNELPSKGEGLEALWDRFLVRLIVVGVEDKQRFNEMISKTLNSKSDTVDEALKISDAEYQQWNKQIDEIAIPENVFHVIHIIRGYVDQHNLRDENKQNQIYISDRRWRKIVRLLRTSAFLNDRTAVDLMDCFLIKDCLWNETEHIEAVTQFVRDAIQKHGYLLSFNFKGLKDELEEFKTDIKKATQFEDDSRIETLSKDSGYYEIENPQSQIDRFIKKEIFDQLTYNNQEIYQDHIKNPSFYRNRKYQARKGRDKYHIAINDIDYKLKTNVTEVQHQIIKEPYTELIKEWDSKVTQFLDVTNSQKDELEAYRTKDLQFLRTNLFVNPELANIVESNLNSTRTEIEKFEIAIREIQNGYNNLKDEVILIQNE